jgi:hypothetical protein
MGEAYAHQAAFIQQAQSFHDGNGVVVAIPNKDALFAYVGGNFGRGETL